MNKKHNLIFKISEGQPIVIQDTINEEGFFILLSFCVNCNKWFCQKCDTLHENKNDHQRLIIFTNNEYYKSITVLLITYKLCLHKYNDLKLNSIQQKFDIEQIKQKYEQYKKFISNEYSHKLKYLFNQLKKHYKEIARFDYSFKIEMLKNAQADNLKILTDISFIFSYIIDSYINQDENSFLSEKVLNSVDFYILDEELKIMDLLPISALYMKIVFYSGIKNKILHTITPQLENSSIELIRMFNNSIIAYSRYCFNGTIIFYDIKKHKYLKCYLTNYSNSLSLFAPASNVIQIDNNTYIISCISFLYFIKLINTETIFDYQIIRKIAFANREILCPINIDNSMYGLFILNNNRLFLSIYSYPYSHLFDIQITIHTEIDLMDNIIMLKNGMIVFQLEDDYLHFVNLEKREDTEIFNSYFGGIQYIKEIENERICIFTKHDPILIINCNTYQIETFIVNCFINPYTIPSEIKTDNVSKVLYKIKQEESLFNYRKIQYLGNNIYIYKYLRSNCRLYSYNQLMILNNIRNLAQKEIY